MRDPLTDEDLGDTVTPPKSWTERPEDWPRRVPYNGIVPNRVRYTVPKADPAFAHLMGLSRTPEKAKRGERVFLPGMAPHLWHPAYQKASGQLHKHIAAKDKREAENPSEEGPETFRALSRAYSSLPEATVKKIVLNLATKAAAGDEKAQAAFIRLEQLVARSPIVDGDAGTMKPEVVENAERELNALVRKVNAVFPGRSCPWCGQNVHVAE